MISDRFELSLYGLLDHTKKHKIKWRPIYEYIRTDVQPYSSPEYVYASIRDYIRNIRGMCSELYENKSFFVQKDGYVLALLNYKESSFKDDSVHEVLELVGGIYSTPVIRIPEYINGGFVALQKAILQYWKFKENDYNLEYSDSFELLDAFVNLDDVDLSGYNLK